MAKQNESNQDEGMKQSEKVLGELNGNKKLFVEPEISDPVDVLEATTFFQPGTSGATN